MVNLRPDSRFGLVYFLILVAAVFASCAIEPPLKLAQEKVELKLPIVITDLEMVWDIEEYIHENWWYGWDEEDIERWGKLEYPTPTYFEVRRYYQGEEMQDRSAYYDGFTLYDTSFRRNYDYGYHDLLIWSNINSKDGTQTVLINEEDMDNILATTTQASTSYSARRSRVVPLRKQPDVFFRTFERNLYISHFPEDYDYFDEKESVWVKLLHAQLDPVVYIYLVQVVIYNNERGVICGMADDATLAGLSEGVNLNTGRTLNSESDVVFNMRMKKNLKARNDRMADIFGSKFTTFGLCDMEQWSASRGHEYSGSRTDLTNRITLDFQFNNSSDALFSYNVTDQVRRQPHGGVITIEIDADTITVPSTGSSASSGFNPLVEEYNDTIIHDFGI